MEEYYRNQIKVQVQYYNPEGPRERTAPKMAPQLPAQRAKVQPKIQAPSQDEKAVAVKRPTPKWILKLEGAQTAPQHSTFPLDNCPYVMKLLAEPSPRTPQLKINVQICRKSESTTLPNGGYGLPLFVNIKYGKCDVIGKSFSLYYGQQIASNKWFNVGETMVIGYDDKKAFSVSTTVTIGQLGAPFSVSGCAMMAFDGFSKIYTMPDTFGVYYRCLGGPLFYTSPEGYLVKLEVSMEENIEAYLTFLAGKNDQRLSNNFLHVATVVLFNTSNAPRAKHISKSKVHDLAMGPVYRIFLASRADVIGNGFVADNCLRLYVNIQPLGFPDNSTSQNCFYLKF